MSVKLIPGVVSATFKTESTDFVIEQAVKNGLQAIEWSENAHVQPGDALGALLLKEKTNDAGLEIAAYGSYYRLGEYENPLEQFQKSLVSAKALGAPVIRIWAGVKPSAQADEAYRTKLASEAALLAEAAKKVSIQLAFEWHKDTLTDTNESAMNLLEAADSDNLYCLWQPTVALSMQQRCKGVKLLGDKLANFHVYYWLEGVRRPLAEGEAEWLAYLKGFDGHGTHYALLEFVMGNTAEQFAEDAAALKEILQKAHCL